MSRIAAALAAALAAASPALAADAVRFVDEAPDLIISFEPLVAEEQWYVSGACDENRAATPLRVHVAVFRARYTVRIVRNRLNADRIICLDNALAAPKEFWRAYYDR